MYAKLGHIAVKILGQLSVKINRTSAPRVDLKQSFAK